MENWIIGLLTTQDYYRTVIERAKEHPLDGDDEYISDLESEIERIDIELRSILA